MTIVARTLTAAILRGMLAALFAICVAPAAQAQMRGCTIKSYADPPREVLSCGTRLTITAEPGADYRVDDRNGAALSQGAVLVDSPPSRGGFEVRTPHAIASVRGTSWAVDVTYGRTSVFVRAGIVEVRRPGGSMVTLGPGDGVDVDAGGGVLEVKRWAPARAAALLARLGQQ